MTESKRTNEPIFSRGEYLLLAGVIVAAVAVASAGEVAGVLPKYQKPTPTPESPEHYAIDHDRYSVLLSDGGHGVLCYSNNLPTKTPVGTKLEVIIPPSNTYCVEANSYLLSSTDRQALGIPGNLSQGTIDVFVNAATITDRNQVQPPSKSLIR